MDADPKKLRAWGRLLSTLLQTPDDELDDFLRERLGGANLEERSLGKARALLARLGEAFDDPTPERWKGIEHAADTIDHWEEGRSRTEDGDASSSASPSTGPSSPSPSSEAPPAPTPARPPTPTPAVHTSPRPPSGPSPWARGRGAHAPDAPAPTPAVAPPVAPPPPAPIATPSPPAPAPLLRGDSALMGTAPASPKASAAEPLPFRSDPTSSAPTPAADHLEPNPAFGATVAKGGGKGPTLPFAAVSDQRPGAVSEPPAGMTLGKYAELCVERKLWPDNAAGRRARFGIDEAGEAQADAYFKRRFERDHAQRQTWLALCDVHKKKLTDQG